VIQIGVIGYGYWGPNLVRNFAETPGVDVHMVADLDSAKLALVQRRYPAVKVTSVELELAKRLGFEEIVGELERAVKE